MKNLILKKILCFGVLTSQSFAGKYYTIEDQKQWKTQFEVLSPAQSHKALVDWFESESKKKLFKKLPQNNKVSELPHTLKISSQTLNSFSKNEKLLLQDAPAFFWVEGSFFNKENFWSNQRFLSKIIGVIVSFENLLTLSNEWLENLQKTKFNTLHIDLSESFFFTYKCQAYFKEYSIESGDERFAEAIAILLNTLSKNKYPLVQIRFDAHPWMSKVNECFQRLNAFHELEALVWNFSHKIPQSTLQTIQKSAFLKQLYKQSENKRYCIAPQDFCNTLSLFKNLESLEISLYIQPEHHDAFIQTISEQKNLSTLLLENFFPQKNSFNLMKQCFSKLKKLQTLGLDLISHPSDLEIFENWNPKNNLRLLYIDSNTQTLNQTIKSIQEKKDFQQKVLDIVDQFPNLEEFPNVLELSDQILPSKNLFSSLAQKKEIESFSFTLSHESVSSIESLLLGYPNLKEFSLRFIESEESENLYNEIPFLKTNKTEFSSLIAPFLRKISFIRKIQSIELSFYYIDVLIIEKIYETLQALPEIFYFSLDCQHEKIPEIKYENQKAFYVHNPKNPSQLGKAFQNLCIFLQKKEIDYRIVSNNCELFFEKQHTQTQGKLL